jgi:hypothetical protein
MLDYPHWTKPQNAADEFSEWASMFSGEIFVKLAAYIDESGRHDKTGRLVGSARHDGGDNLPCGAHKFKRADVHTTFHTLHAWLFIQVIPARCVRCLVRT